MRRFITMVFIRIISQFPVPSYVIMWAIFPLVMALLVRVTDGSWSLIPPRGTLRVYIYIHTHECTYMWEFWAQPRTKYKSKSPSTYRAQLGRLSSSSNVTISSVQRRPGCDVVSFARRACRTSTAITGLKLSKLTWQRQHVWFINFCCCVHVIACNGESNTSQSDVTLFPHPQKRTVNGLPRVRDKCGQNQRVITYRWARVFFNGHD